MSVSKTKRMIVGRCLSKRDTSPVQVDGGAVEIVDQFTYLGAEICRDGEVTADVTARIAKAARANQFFLIKPCQLLPRGMFIVQQF